jgi:hypothetical protein
MKQKDDSLRFFPKNEFNLLIEKECNRSERFDQFFSLAIFEPINDNAVKKFSKEIAQKSRSSDIIGWLSDNKIGIILIESDNQEAFHFAEELSKKVTYNKIPVPFTIVTYPESLQQMKDWTWQESNSIKKKNTIEHNETEEDSSESILSNSSLNEKSRKVLRTDSEVINQAISENKKWESLLYIFSIMIFLFGFGVVMHGIISGLPLSTLTGVISESLLIPTMWFARKIRTENISIRLLESILHRSSTEKLAAEAIKQYLINTSDIRNKQKTKMNSQKEES